MKPKIQSVKIDSLRLEESCQAREQMNDEALEAYAAAYSQEDHTMPAVEVVDVDGDLVVIDGFHRYAAALKAGRTFIRCEIIGSGDLEFAAWTALSKNHSHGVRRTIADKNKAVRLALDGDGQAHNSRVIARHIGVSHTFVSKIRKEWDAEHRADTAEPAGNVASAEPDTGAQEVPPADSDDFPDETPDASRAEPSCLERAQAINRIAAALCLATKRSQGEIERISRGDFLEIERAAKLVLGKAKKLKEQCAEAQGKEESELRKAS